MCIREESENLYSLFVQQLDQKHGEIGQEHFSNELRYSFGVLCDRNDLYIDEKNEIILASKNYNKASKEIRDLDQKRSLLFNYRSKDIVSIDESTRLEIDNIIQTKPTELINSINFKFFKVNI